MIVVVLYYWLLCTIGRIGRSLPLPLPWPLLLLLFLLDRCRCRCHCHCCCRCCYSYCTFTQWASRVKWFSSWKCVKLKFVWERNRMYIVGCVMYTVHTTKYHTVRHTRWASVSNVRYNYITFAGILTFVHCLWSWNYFVKRTHHHHHHHEWSYDYDTPPSITGAPVYLLYCNLLKIVTYYNI